MAMLSGTREDLFQELSKNKGDNLQEQRADRDLRGVSGETSSENLSAESHVQSAVGNTGKGHDINSMGRRC